MSRLAVVAAAALLLAACSSGGDTAAVRIEPTTTAAAGTGVAMQSATPLAASVPAPVPTATSNEAQTLAPVHARTAATGDLAGFPFSTGDMRLAVEQAGVTFLLVELGDTICPGSAVPGRPYWSANRAGSDFGPVFLLWVYPDQDALGEDWEAAPGEAPRLRVEGCELPTGFVYWNENLVLTFAVWLSAGEELTLDGHHEGPGDHPAVRAFLGLTP